MEPVVVPVGTVPVLALPEFWFMAFGKTLPEPLLEGLTAPVPAPDVVPMGARAAAFWVPVVEVAPVTGVVEPVPSLAVLPLLALLVVLPGLPAVAVLPLLRPLALPLPPLAVAPPLRELALVLPVPEFREL